MGCSSSSVTSVAGAPVNMKSVVPLGPHGQPVPPYGAPYLMDDSSSDEEEEDVAYPLGQQHCVYYESETARPSSYKSAHSSAAYASTSSSLVARSFARASEARPSSYKSAHSSAAYVSTTSSLDQFASTMTTLRLPPRAPVRPVWTHGKFHSHYLIMQKIGTDGHFNTVYAASSVASAKSDNGVDEAAEADGIEEVKDGKAANKGSVMVKVADLRADCENSGSRYSEAFKVDRRRHRQTQNEVVALQALQNSEHVHSLQAAYLTAGFSYLVMERYEMTFVQYLQNLEAVTEVTLREPFRQMLTALRAVHAASIIHCAVRPDNFLCTIEGSRIVVKLSNFHSARWQSLEGEKLTGACGTVAFAAPEALRDETCDDQVDTWSLGVLVYCLFYGEFPYETEAMHDDELRRLITDGLVEPVFQAAPELGMAARPSPEAEEFVMGLLDRDPALRFNAVEALETQYITTASLCTSGSSTTTDVGAPSLLPAVDAVCRRCIFVGNCQDREQDQESNSPLDLDFRLFALQSRFHGSEDLPLGALLEGNQESPTPPMDSIPGSMPSSDGSLLGGGASPDADAVLEGIATDADAVLQ